LEYEQEVEMLQKQKIDKIHLKMAQIGTAGNHAHMHTKTAS
jgi:hypothetical protein